MMQRQESRQRAAQLDRPAQARPAGRTRPTPKQFLEEVRIELRKVAWPTRGEVINSTLIVLVAVTVLTTLIFGYDWLFSRTVLWVFD
jgi:preprotein translocase subunit SecE